MVCVNDSADSELVSAVDGGVGSVLRSIVYLVLAYRGRFFCGRVYVRGAELNFFNSTCEVVKLPRLLRDVVVDCCCCWRLIGCVSLDFLERRVHQFCPGRFLGEHAGPNE